MKTWYTIKDGRIDRIRQTESDTPPDPEWHIAPKDWGGNHGDKIEWFNSTMFRIPDAELVNQGKRIDNRGRWYSKDNPGETKQIYDLDEESDEGYTQEPPLQNEPYQKWSEQKNKWVVDTEKKEAAEKENEIAKKQAAIEDAERRIQRSTRAKLAGTNTQEDDQFFDEISSEIELLREEKRQLLSA